MGRAVDVRIYSAARTTGGAEFTVLLKGAAGKVSTDSPVETNGTFGLETFAMVAAVAAWGEQSRGEEMIRFADNDSAAGALIKASSRSQ